MAPATSLFCFRVLKVLLASTFTLVFPLETLGLTCQCVPEDVVISPLLLSSADVMPSVRLRCAGSKSGINRCSFVGFAVPSFRIWSAANIVNISPDATAAASAVVMRA